MLSGGDGPSKLPLHKFPLIPCSSSPLIDEKSDQVAGHAETFAERDLAR